MSVWTLALHRLFLIAFKLPINSSKIHLRTKAKFIDVIEKKKKILSKNDLTKDEFIRTFSMIILSIIVPNFKA